jgi:hypothetical protein
MKLTIKRKVANGLVVGFMLPPVTAGLSEAIDIEIGGLEAYAAEEDFDLASTQSDTADVMLAVTDPCDPSGVDPSGVSTVCVEPAGGLPVLCVRAPTELVTAEDGTSDFFEVYSGPGVPDPSGSNLYYFESSNRYEGRPATEAVVLNGTGESSCVPEPVWIAGMNDGWADDDRYYEIHVISEFGNVEVSLPAVNLDNDGGVPAAVVGVYGPQSLPAGGSGMFDVYVWNRDPEGAISGSDFLIEPSAGLELGSYIVTGGGYKGKPKLTRSGALLLRQVAIPAQESILVSMEVTMIGSGEKSEKIVARIIDNETGYENDNSQTVRMSLR